MSYIEEDQPPDSKKYICSGLRHDLLACIKSSPCYKMGMSPKECLKTAGDNLDPKCPPLYYAFFECSRGCYASDYLIWTEDRQKECRYNSVLYSLSILAIEEGQPGGGRDVVCSCLPKVELSVSDTIVLMIPKAKFFCGLIFLYSLKRKLFKIVNLCEIASSNLQPWKIVLSVKYFMSQQYSLETKNEDAALMVSTSTGSLNTSFYILDMNRVLWRLIIDERELLFIDIVCSIDLAPFVSDEVLQMTSFQQLIFILKGNNLRVHELTQGVCVQSDIRPDGEFYIYTYLFHKYKKLAISTKTNVYLIEVGVQQFIHTCSYNNIAKMFTNRTNRLDDKPSMHQFLRHLHYIIRLLE
ncbi:hypothetical protein LOD99_14102 [Oopsacas minuta]|uniref:Uncharacterized protein n=1 Tax=Oopsacas minuta TaxID=111878 RepID=A0AAV7KI14_9METZ|nr:hypothetical protein LOD99_14102 [Oopsacas minuta]